jgi:hypothetical protein
MLECRSSWGENCVYFHDDRGQVRRIPAIWTDTVGEDPLVVIAGGRSALRVEDLLRLVELVGRLAGERDGGRK